LSDRICKIFSYPARRNGAATAVSPRHANGHANGDANGHTNGNTNGHLNGHANGENGHVPALTDATGMVLKAGDTNVDRRHSGSGQDLVPFVIEGFKQELASTSLPVGQIEPFIAHPLPLWKRALDISCSLTALVVFAPVMVTVAMAIRMTMGTPVLFKQRRTGLGGKPFLLYKFRTMVPDAEAKKAALRRFSEQDGPAFKMKVDPRVTPLGSFLRRTSLDELPQLWNVVRGDMSMVGPRPLPCDESDACEPWQLRRLDVTPGITCIWQVKGRSTVTFTEWVRMDMAYIRRRKFMNDLAILFQTIPAVLKRRGAR
jgi:lipopolysaccharide/colanic/teichoic acid biosynthesis glycosyltransferase